MAGVDVTFEALEPVAFALDRRHLPVVLRQHVALEARQGWWRLAWTHIRPDDAVALDTRICGGLDLVLEIRLGRFVGHVDAGAVDRELPTVVHASQTALFVTSEEQRGAAVWTVVLDQANLPGRVAEGDQVLTQQHHTQRVGVWRG